MATHIVKIIQTNSKEKKKKYEKKSKYTKKKEKETSRKVR